LRGRMVLDTRGAKPRNSLLDGIVVLLPGGYVVYVAGIVDVRLKERSKHPDAARGGDSIPNIAAQSVSGAEELTNPVVPIGPRGPTEPLFLRHSSLGALNFCRHLAGCFSPFAISQWRRQIHHLQ
jgi:hypothetical protein